MNNSFKISNYFLAIVLALSFASCKEHTLISSHLINGTDTLHFKSDTLYTCTTHTFYEDDNYTSINLSGIPIYQGIGSLRDSFFGTTISATNFQISNPLPGNVLDTSYHIDSIYLILPYSEVTYGDTSASSPDQSFQVFYLDDTLDYYTPYYSYTHKSVNLNYPLSQPFSVKINHLGDSSYIFGANRMPSLHVKLDAQNTMRFLNAAMNKSVSTLTTDPAATFISQFKGICVRPTDYRNVAKAIPYFRLDPIGTDAFSQAGIVVFYRNPTAGQDSTTTMVFAYNQGGCANFNSITKSYARYPVNNLFNSVQANDSVVALNNMPGACIDMKIGGINHIAGDTNFLTSHVINQAMLQISVINESGYQNPDQIYPVGIGNGTYPSGITNGLPYIVQDRLPETSLTPYYILDGYPHNITYDGSKVIKTYNFGIPREVISSIVAKNDTLHFHIHGTQIVYGAYQMIAAGGNYSDKRYRAKLIVVHSSLK